jgi:hypothetical protein
VERRRAVEQLSAAAGAVVEQPAGVLPSGRGAPPGAAEPRLTA